MEVYKRLSIDLQEKVDSIVWDKTKQKIPQIDLVFKRLELNWIQYSTFHEQNQKYVIYKWEDYQLKIIKHFCNEILRPRIYGKGYSGCNTESGKYEYIVDKKKNGYYSLGYVINRYVFWLEHKNDEGGKKYRKPDFDDLYDECRLAIDDWVDTNIKDNRKFQEVCLELGLNILDMFEKYEDDFSDNPFHEVNYRLMVFAHYYCDCIERILMISYNWDIEDLNSDNEDEEQIAMIVWG